MRSLLLGAAALCCIGVGSAQAREVHVGVYSNAPKIFLDESGKPAGIFVDLLEAIAAREGWQLRYEPCLWEACLEALRAGRLDLMPDVAYSAQRDDVFDFHSTPALHSWSQVFARRDLAVRSVFDLEGKRVAMLSGSIQERNFRGLVDGFGLKVQMLRVDSLSEAFALVSAGGADAAISNNLFGDYNAAKYGLAETPVVFQPAQLFFASKQGTNADLLSAIDRQLDAWRMEGDAPYTRILEKWRGQTPGRLPIYVLQILGALAVSILLLLGGVVLLRRQVKRRTRELAAERNALQEREQQLRTLSDNLPDGLIYQLEMGEGGEQRRFTYLSSGVEVLHGVTAAEAKADPMVIYGQILDEDRKTVQDIEARSVREMQTFHAEFRILRGNGEVRWHLTRSAPRRLQNGKVIWDGIELDITERKRTELELERHRHHLEDLIAERTSALRASEERFRALATLAPVGIYLADEKGKCQYANPRWCEIAGLAPEDALDDGWKRGLHPDDLEAVTGNWQRMIESRGRWGMEYRFRTPAGKVSWVYGLAVPIDDSSGQTTGFVGINLDITERRMVEEQLRQAKVAAETANIAKSAFLANMSHEIRTPLNAITGMAHILRGTPLTPLQGDKLDKIESAGEHLLEIINSVLDLSKIEAGKFTLESLAVHVNELVQEVAAMFSDKAREKGIAFDVVLLAGSRPLVGDRTRLKQALLNYVANAVKFTDRGRITLRTREESETPEAVTVRFEVEDTGVGIAPEAVGKLFNAFEQADTSMTRKYGGTGLGLVITKKIAEQMGGTAGVRTLQGSGSTFWFSAVLRKAESVPATVATPSDDNVERALRAHAGKRILVVDDEPTNREIVRAILETVGLDVAVAEDGVVAVEMAASGQYDLLLMDMQMPRMDGLEAVRVIRRLPGCAAVPIVAMTANAFAEDKARCLEVGMCDFLTKPVRPSAMFPTLLHWLSEPRGPN